jgi:hypothetical protein
MDTILDKLLETIKEKMSKKQVIAIVGMVVLYLLTAHPGYVAGVAIIAIVAQTYLDKEKNNVQENDKISDVSADND